MAKFTNEQLASIKPLTWITMYWEPSTERVLLTSEIKFKGNKGKFSYYSPSEKQCYQNGGESSQIISFDAAPAI
jgi:hypothetical protein